MYDEIKEYNKEIMSFHMPGHKGKPGIILEHPHLYDVTEVEGTDDLHHATGIIKDVCDQIATVFGAYKTFMLVNGSTSGILASVSATTKKRDTIMIARNCHKSVFNSVLVNELEVKYLYPKYDETYDFFTNIEPSDLLKALDLTKDVIQAVVITSPTYEGITSDIRGISQICHDHNIVLIVDEAHGAHLVFGDQLPSSSLEQGADIVIQSTHKTLPCLTQSAILHVSKDAVLNSRVDLNEMQRYLSIYQTSSPSYVLMSSIEEGIKYMEEHRMEYNQLVAHTINKLNGYSSDYGKWLSNDDRTRLTYLINPNRIAMTGWNLSAALRHKYKIQVELSSEHYIIAITTIMDTIENITYLMDSIDGCIEEYLMDSIDGFTEEHLAVCKEAPSVKSENIKKSPNHNLNSKYKMDGLSLFRENQLNAALPIYKAVEEPYENIALNKCVGRISREFIIPYPPGIPMVVPGEKLTVEMCEYLKQLVKNDREVYGIIEGEIHVLKEQK
jgi:lysine decarboxylase